LDAGDHLLRDVPMVLMLKKNDPKQARLCTE
jgi:hypothetical protein